MPWSSLAPNLYSQLNPPRAQSAVLLLYKEERLGNDCKFTQLQQDPRATPRLSFRHSLHNGKLYKPAFVDVGKHEAKHFRPFAHQKTQQYVNITTTRTSRQLGTLIYGIFCHWVQQIVPAFCLFFAAFIQCQRSLLLSYKMILMPRYISHLSFNFFCMVFLLLV